MLWGVTTRRGGNRMKAEGREGRKENLTGRIKWAVLRA